MIDMNAIARERVEKQKELRRVKRLANQMIEIGCRDFRGPIEMTTRVSQVRKELKRAVKQVFPL